MLLWVALLTSIPLLTLYILDRSRHFRLKQYAGYPQLPPSLVWGHMKALDEVMGQGDRRRHIDQVFLEIAQKLHKPPLFIADLRPVLYSICVICSHEVAEQISRSSKTFPYSLPKGDVLDNFIPLIGKGSIISAQGSEWKSLRKRFNPGFAPQHLISLLPGILDRVQRFVEILDSHAVSGEVFALNEPCINLTFDIIGTVTMDSDLRAQCGCDSQSPIVTIFRQLVSLYRTSGSASWDQFKIGTKLQRWKLSKKLDDLLQQHVRGKFQAWKTRSTTGTTADAERSRSVLALSFEGIDELNQAFLDQTCDQLKTFLFAGHDTTSSLLQWAYYQLSRTPHALRAVREELDDILGPDASPANIRAQLVSPRGENLLSRMRYTAAVVKEALRLHPPAGTGRFVPHGTGFNVTLPDGQVLCVDGMILHNCETIIQRDERVYGASKDAFLPERWLEHNTGIPNLDLRDDTGIPVSAWRPFERGPRNCIGQELANLEARVVLACTLRRFNFAKVGLGEVVRDTKGDPVIGEFGAFEVREELFNIMEVTGKPVDGTQMRVSFAQSQE
ncbi:cytochrome P450 [Aspergillus granulosus]|uniref:Cytochrome P450 n=1 Tax=Aspergillus granulosus TaxID=176169 RepID=A0ABR4H518_9EURO